MTNYINVVHLDIKVEIKKFFANFRLENCEWRPDPPFFGTEHLILLKERLKSPDYSEEYKKKITEKIADLTVLVKAKKQLWTEIEYLNDLVRDSDNIEKTELKVLFEQKKEEYLYHPADQARHDFFDRWYGNPYQESLDILFRLTQKRTIKPNELELLPQKITVLRNGKEVKINPFHEWLHDPDNKFKYKIKSGMMKETKRYQRRLYDRLVGKNV